MMSPAIKLPRQIVTSHPASIPFVSILSFPLFVNISFIRRLQNTLSGRFTMDIPFSVSNAGPMRRSARLLSAIHANENLAKRAINEDSLLASRQNNGLSSMDTREASSSLLEVRESLIEKNESFDQSSPSKKRKRTKLSPPNYVIPDVEKKKATFKGRLGYACLNTVLRNQKPSSESVFCSRTCRLDTLKKKGNEYAKGLGLKNMENLLTIIQWNEDNNIRLFRLSSEMFPYASHGTYGYSLDYCSELLKKAGTLARKYGHRLTTHPGQFTQLGSPKASVVEAAIRELVYHCQMLDLMGMDADSVMIIHGGGVYNDKPATLIRLRQSIMNLPKEIRQRLVLENDEMCYNAEDLLPICEELDVPLVFDYHHDMLFPSSLSPAEIIKRVRAIWLRRGIRPKQHLSEPRPGAVTLMERRAHSDRCEKLPADLPDDMDLMIEAKDKEQAVFHLHRIYDLQPVIAASLRPANTNPSMHTNGRKSTKRARAMTAKEVLMRDDLESDNKSDDKVDGIIDSTTE
ncbi:UV-endonuclease UvdE [Pholiota conissans]|uniref:UV-endonuclease UvdE n=1 Tax=Pholiota conissans TaxID=109636 RepID=A0A9P6CZY9_9AGAR|nr:UV-endonuclease UvdE [Pholiota conissans]